MSRRITGAIIGTVVASLILVWTGTFLFARVAIRNASLQRLERQAVGLSDLLPASAVTPPVGVPDPLRESTKAKLATILEASGVTEFVISANGVVIGERPSFIPAGRLDLDALRNERSISGVTRGRLWAAAGRRGALGITIVAAISAAQEPFFGPTLRWFTVFAIIAVAAALIVSAWLGRRLSRPVMAAVATTRRIAGGDLSARLDQDGPSAPGDELAALGRSINAMAAELERSHGLERQFLMSITHDLRTPLTSIHGYAEAIVDDVASSPRDAAAIIVTEAGRLERLIDDLLDLAKLDQQQFTLRAVETNLVPIIESAAQSIETQCAAAGLVLHVDAPDDATVLVDVDRLAQVIGNLSANAIKYARTAVWIRTRDRGAGIDIEVADDGNGIPPADLSHVFKRLYQATNAPERRESGSGLGLAIVKELAEAMGGTVAVASTQGTGTTFTVRLPRR